MVEIKEMSDTGHDELRRSIESSREEGREDSKDLGKRLDELFSRWEAWSDAQDTKFEEFREKITRAIEGTRGDIAAALTGPIQRIEKQFDKVAIWREHDLKELYTVAAKVDAHGKDISAAHDKYRRLDEKIEKIESNLPAQIKIAVKEALKEQEGIALKKTLAWIAGIIGAIIAEYIALRILK